MKYLLFMTICAVTMLATDVTGTWTGTLVPTNDDANGSHSAYLVLKQDGNKLTGTAGPSDAQGHVIENGKVEGGKLTFQLGTPAGVMRFELKEDGDELKGNVTREGDGEKQTATLSVKRQK